jgi:outer membrane protein TolC
MTKLLLYKLALFGLSLNFASIAFAEVTLSSDQYLSCVIEKQKRLVKNETIDASAKLDVRRHAFWPKLDSSASFGQEYINQPPGLNTGLGNLTLSQPLFSASDFKRLEAAKIEFSQAQAVELDAIYKKSLQMLTNYFELALLDENLRLNQEVLKHAETSVQLLGDLRKVKSVEHSDWLLAKSDFLKLQNQQRELEMQRTKIMDDLLVNSTLTQPLHINLVNADAAPVLKLENIKKTLDSHVGLSQLRLQISSLDAELRAEDRTRWPLLSLDLTYDNVFYGQTPEIPATDLAIFGRITLPLYDRDIRSAEVARLSAQKTVHEEVLMQRRSEISLLLQEIQNEIEVISDSMSRSRESKDLAARARDIAWTKIRVSQLNYVNYLEYEKNYVSAISAFNKLSIRHEALIAQLKLFSYFSDDPNKLWRKVNGESCLF